MILHILHRPPALGFQGGIPVKSVNDDIQLIPVGFIEKADNLARLIVNDPERYTRFRSFRTIPFHLTHLSTSPSSHPSPSYKTSLLTSPSPSPPQSLAGRFPQFCVKSRVYIQTHVLSNI